MANTTANSDFVAGNGLWQRFCAWFVGLGQAVYVSRGIEARTALLQKLQQKSDHELAEMGLRRDDLAAYVFRDMLHY